MEVKRRRRLRKLVPDEDLLRRRAAGEALRELAADYDVAHTTLSRYFGRPDVRKQLKATRRELRAEQRQVRVRRIAERRLERQVRRRADEQDARETEQERLYRAELSAWNSGRRFRGDTFEARLDERDAPRRPMTYADRHNTYDKEAEQIVSAGGGTRELLAATELQTLQAAADSIDPELLREAFDNDALARAEPRLLALRCVPRLRRLVPDTELLRRYAEGEPLRVLAGDYDVAHTTLVRFFARPQIERELRHTVDDLRAERRVRTAR